MTHAKLFAVSGLAIVLAAFQTTSPRTAAAGSASDEMSAMAEAKAAGTAAQCDGKTAELSYTVADFPTIGGNFRLRFVNGGARIEDFSATSNAMENPEGPVTNFARQGDVVTFRSTANYEYELRMNGCDIKFGRASGYNATVGSVSINLRGG